jgi:hypothetical protein
MGRSGAGRSSTRPSPRRRAIEAGDLGAIVGDDVEEIGDDDLDLDDERPTDRPPSPGPEEPSADVATTRVERTEIIDLASIQRRSALPFGGEPRRAPPAVEHTTTIDLAWLQASRATPFEAPQPPREDTPQRPPRTDALPFAPRPVATALSPEPLPRFEPAPVIADLAVAPATPAPAPIAARVTSLLALETYAAIKAELWRRSPLALPAVAAEHGLTEVEWLSHDLRYADAINAEAKQGASVIAASVARAMAAAKRARAPSDDLNLAEYLALKNEIEASGDASGALKKRGLPRRALRRIERRWQPNAATEVSAARRP